jgi:single-stranded-DNA-specific exonuclease
VNGGLSRAAEAEALDVSLKLELNEWNGAVEPRVVLGELYPPGPSAAEDPAEPDEEEWWHRLDAERRASLEPWPPVEFAGAAGSSRSVVERPGGSGVSTVAALASSGGSVLALCADALRRRGLVERAAAPARFGGGGVAIASGRLADGAIRAVAARIRDSGGVALADWAALTRVPGLPAGFEHVVVIDPPPFPHLERLAATPAGVGSAGRGYLHLTWGEAEVELGFQVLAEDWPLRPTLVALYRSLRNPVGELRDVLRGTGRYRRSPEIAGRRLRVLEELGAVRWQASGTKRALRVVSSEQQDLERSQAFVAFSARFQEGQRFLSRRRQAS